MKKLILGIALSCFIAFGTLGIQTALAADSTVEMVKYNDDNDPAKKAQPAADGKEKKDAKACDKSKVNCKEGEAKCPSKAKCCPSKQAKPECKKGDGDKK